MSDLNEILELTQQYDAIMKERDMAAAYIAITAEMGPCPQLLAFINYDNSMQTEDGIGLESMNMFDQHNFMLSKLNVDALDAMGMESLKDVIIKYRKWLIVGGIFIPFIGWPGLIAGIAGVIMNNEKKGTVPSVKKFTALTKIFDGAMRQESMFTAAIPSSMDEKLWAAIDLSGYDSSLNDAEMQLGTAASIKEEDIDDSGWTVVTYVNALKWLETNKEKLETASKAQAQKFDHVESAVGTKDGGSNKHVSGVVSQAAKMSHFTTGVFEDITKLMVKVSHYFDPKKKD